MGATVHGLQGNPRMPCAPRHASARVDAAAHDAGACRQPDERVMRRVNRSANPSTVSDDIPVAAASIAFGQVASTNRVGTELTATSELRWT